ncbi:hypothetical protein ACVR0G_10550 [Streptococcus criceti]
MMASARRIHEEVVLRMDKKYTKGLDTSLSHTSDINSGKNAYKTKHLSYEKKHYGSYQVAQPNGGYKTETYLSKTTTEHYSLNDLLSDEKSPIKATQAVYDTRVANFREIRSQWLFQ